MCYISHGSIEYPDMRYNLMYHFSRIISGISFEKRQNPMAGVEECRKVHLHGLSACQCGSHDRGALHLYGGPSQGIFCNHVHPGCIQYNLADIIALLLQVNIPTRKGHGKLAASMKKNNQQHHNMKWVGGIIM